MSTLAEQKSAPKESSTLPCQLPEDIVKMMRVIAAHTGETHGEIADPFLRPGITKRFKKVVSELHDSGEAGA